MIMIFFFFLFHESDSVYKFDDFFFSIRVEMYLYEGYFSLYENLLRVLNKLFKNSYWVDGSRYCFENFATSTITYVRKLIM